MEEQKSSETCLLPKWSRVEQEKSILGLLIIHGDFRKLSLEKSLFSRGPNVHRRAEIPLTSAGNN